MKRAPIVLAGTAAGLAAVLSYHASGNRNLLLASAGAARTAGGGGAAAKRSGAHRTAAPTGDTHKTSTGTSGVATETSSTAAAAAPTPALTRSALGQDVQYPYGELQVKVTMVGPRIRSVALVKINVPDAQSGAIDQIALPELRAQALAAQSAQINGVSGATYTSAAYQQSLQSAIDRLKA